MKTAVVTGCSGDLHQRMLDVTAPLMQQWAAAHGYDFRDHSLQGELPPSWHKIDAMLEAFACGYDQVLWVDCDVATTSTLLSPFSEMEPNHKQGVVVHRTECGDVPNCGVWAARSSLAQDLMFARSLSQHLRDNPWWEQAAIMQMIGFRASVDTGGSRFERSTPLYEATKFLHPRWNWHPSDASSTVDAAFYHITQRWIGEDRVKKLAHIANNWR